MLQAEVQSAVHKGEQRMMKAENMLKDMNKKTKASLNMRITSKVSLYAKKAAAQINNLRMSSKAARAEMRKEMMMAVKTAAQEAKKNLAAAYKQSRKMFRAANAKEAKAAKASAVGRAKLAKSIAAQQKAAQRQLTDAVGTMSRSLSALKVETRKKIKKANKSITAYADQLIKEQKAVNALMSSQMKVLKGKIKKTRAHSLRAIGKANEESAAGFASVNRKIAAAMKKANKAAKDRFAKLFAKMSKQRKQSNQQLNAEVHKMNRNIAKQVRDARKSFATRIATTTSSIKDQESRLLGEIKLVGEELLSFKASQLRVNRRTTAEMKRITTLANLRNSQSVRARGKLRALLDANKKAAHEEVKALNALFTRKLASVRTKATQDARQAGRDLRAATGKLYGKLAKVQLAAALANAKSAKKINKYAKKSQAAIVAARRSFNARLVTMTNRVASNARKATRGLEVLTGVIRKYKSNGKKDRALIRSQNKALGKDLQAKNDRYIQEGEARAKRIAHRARRNLKAAKKSMLLEISARVEATADKIFKSVQGNHKKIADNYLSLKAYAVTARGKLSKYVKKGGKNLSSLGELMTAVAALSGVKVPKAEGIGSGASSIH